MSTDPEHAQQVVEALTSALPKYVVGVGASAGGLSALTALFDDMPADTGAAFVVVQHLSPDFKSLMNDLLKSHCKMPVKQACDLQSLEANCVYVLPERKNIMLANGNLILSDVDSNQLHHPIDTFFKSLAEDCHERAAGIVLSGTGNDGSRGIEELNGVGALTIAQQPESAEFDGMPQSAINTGAVNKILVPEEMGHVIREYGQILKAQKEMQSSQNDAFMKVVDEIFELIKANTELDLSDYKASTVQRRILHRMGVLGMNNIQGYCDYLKQEKSEQSMLVSDLLIGVTQFFRDVHVWPQLTELVIKPLILDTGIRDVIRVWVPGCSSGEEAYTISMLFEQAMEELNETREIKIFASDIDSNATRRGSIGCYNHAIIDEVPAGLLKKYFVNTRDGYVVTDSVRQRVVFATHNVVQDPPFSNMDLISCRNLLIYFQAVAQKKILSYFHFALKPKGYLLLGTAENCSALGQGFSRVTDQMHLYKKRSDTKVSLSKVGLNRDIVARQRRPSGNALSVDFTRSLDKHFSYINKIREELFKSYVPPAIVIDDKQNVVYSFGNTEIFTKKIRPGSHSSHFASVLHDYLVPLVSSMLKQVGITDKRVAIKDIPLDEAGISCNLSCHFRPLSEGLNAGHYVLVFEVVTGQTGKPAALADLPLRDQRDTRIEELNLELGDARDTIGRKQQDVDALTEEVQCINEELMASNEELQSTNEELQSVNEELFTVNGEYQEKIKELESTNRDLDNLLKSTDVGVVYLDNTLLIRRFTEKAQRYTRLLPLDLNRPFADIALKFDEPAIYDWIDKVLNEGNSMRRFITLDSDKDHQVVLSIYPLCESKGEVYGIILSFLDISELVALTHTMQSASDKT